MAAEIADGLGVQVVYDAALFLPARMDDFLRRFRRILEHAVRDPDAPIPAD
jgi:hypothetical protein